MPVKYTFSDGQRKAIESLLIIAIRKHTQRTENESDQLKRELDLIKYIDCFITILERDVDLLKTIGRYKFHPNQFSENLADTFHTTFRINVTPRKNNNFCKILYICLFEAGAIKEDTEVERYAIAGVEAIKANKNPRKIVGLTESEIKIAEGMYHMDQKKIKNKRVRKKKGIM